MKKSIHIGSRIYPWYSVNELTLYDWDRLRDYVAVYAKDDFRITFNNRQDVRT